MSYSNLLGHYTKIRGQTEAIAEGLSSEDLSAQSMPDASPGKWHLAHTTWFFETFILKPFSKHYPISPPTYSELFNSYYESVGKRHARPNRGLITRPSLEEIKQYRHSVDDAMKALLEEGETDIAALATVGLHHEMQHQELFITDMLHLLSHNPMHPAMLDSENRTPNSEAPASSPSCMTFQAFEGGQCEVGAKSLNKASNENAHWEMFSYDCERPLHTTYLQPYQLASRLVTNREWLAFMEEGGYQTPLLWMSDGWSVCQKEDWNAPLYWQQRDDQWVQFSVNGLRPVDLDAPVCHVSFYEADAYARWAGKRLPTEHEWENVARVLNNQNIPKKSNFLETHYWKPRPHDGNVFSDLYGDVWEWTQSAFSPYPGFKSELGALGEYNGKFMINQCVLKGGSCATPYYQMRPSYRNFFYPHHRWQFSGVRLAGDLS